MRAARSGRRTTTSTDTIDYRTLLAESGGDGEGWRVRFGELLARRWCDDYRARTAWRPHVLEIPIARLTYLFDAAPALDGADGEDRVVGVWGVATAPARARESSRMAGLIPAPERWSGRQLDRGHFVAHSAGGETDLNLFPQARGLNRGWSSAGKRWRALEREASRAGTFLFVRPIYAGSTWVPDALEAGYVPLDGELVVERFANH